MDLQTKALFSSYSYFDLPWRLLLSLQNSESCVVSSVYTNFLFNLWYSTYDLALHQSACYLLATTVKKEQQSIVFFTATKRSHPCNFNNNIIVHMRTQSLVCENLLLWGLHRSWQFNPGKPQCMLKLSSLTHSNSFWAILIIYWQEMLLISFINSTTIDFCFHYFCSSSVTLLMNVNLFIVHLFRNITLYKANYNTNTFWPRGISKRQLEHSLLSH